MRVLSTDAAAAQSGQSQKQWSKPSSKHWAKPLRGFSGAMLLVFGVALTCFLSPSAFGQEDDKRLTREDDPLGEYTSPIDAEMYLQDDSGSLQLVPDISLRDYLRKQGRTENFAFDDISVDVVVAGLVADVKADYKVSFTAGVSNAVVPLALGSCQLSDEPIVQKLPDGAQGRLLADERGYRWSLQSLGEADSSVSSSITLNGKSRVRVESGRQSIRVSLPPKNCVVQVKLPAGSVDERVRMEDFVEREETEDGVLVTIRTRGGECVLSWRSRSGVQGFGATEAESVTRFEVGIANERWSAETQLTLRWFGNADTRAIRISKPQDARWGIYPEDDFERYQIYIEGDSLVVENRDPIENPALELRLEWEWSPIGEAARLSDEVQVETLLEGLKIENVDYHRGQLELVCPASLNIIYEELDSVRFSQRTRIADAFAKQRLLFEFSDEDFGLKLTFRKEKSIPTVRPTYVIEVDESKIVMTGWLECSFDANLRTLALELSFDGWVPQENTAISFEDADSIQGTGDTIQVRESTTESTYRLSIPNFDSAADSGQRRIRQIWRFTAEAPWDSGEREVQFALPKIRRDPNADFDQGSGTVVVNSTGRLLLNWDEASSNGLIPDAVSEQTKKFLVKLGDNGKQRSPTAYRFQTQTATPTWRGTAALLPQSIVVEEAIELEYVDGQVTVEQDFQLQIANEALRTIEVEFANSGTWSDPMFYLNGELVYAQEDDELAASESSGTESDIATDSATARDVKRYRLQGISPVLGQATLTVVTEHRVEETGGSTNSGVQAGFNEISLPVGQLVVGNSARFVRRTLGQVNDAQVLVRRELGGAWLPLLRGNTVSLRPSIAALSVRLQPESSTQSTGLIVLDSWLQTTANLSERQDRFVAVLRTSAKQALLKLPPEASVRPAPRIFVDGFEVSESVGYDQARDTFTVPLATGTGDSEQVLEILYSVRTRLENWTSLEVQPPEILDADQVGRLYWQLATPRSLHLLWNSNNLVPEWRWSWNGLCWERRSSITEEDLVSRLSATPERVPSSFNTYLLSCPGEVRDVQALVVARSVFWFPMGAVVILLATLFLNIAWLRRPGSYLVGLGFLFVLAVFSPDLSVLLGQTAVIAMSLVLLIWTTHSAIESRLRRRSVFSSRFSSDGSERISSIQNPNSRLSATDAAVAADGSR